MNIIDIGSNSVRLMCGKEKYIETTRLAEGMKDGMLSPVSMARTAKAISALKRGECVAFATEAVRKATNRRQFIDLVFETTGLRIHVLSGEEEAEVSFLGATLGYESEATVIDLGGASCEIVSGKGKKIYYARSFTFGCVTLTDMFGMDVNKITDFINNMSFPPIYGKCFAVGGTITSLAAMEKRLNVYDREKVNGTTLNPMQIERLIGEVLSGKDFPTLEQKRRKTIVQGAAAIVTIMKKLNTDLTVSESDNLEGYKLKYLM